MIEDIKELRLQPYGELFAKRNSFCQIHVGPEEFRTTELVPAGIAKLAVGRIVPTETCAGTGVYRGDESIRVQPLHRSQLRDTGNVAVTAVGIHPWQKACVVVANGSQWVPRIWQVVAGGGFETDLWVMRRGTS